MLIFWSSRLWKTTKIHLFSKVEKFRKGKLCLLCKPPVWWKISGRHLLKEYGILKVLELSKTWKFKLSSKICFEKIDTFESHEARKDKKTANFIGFVTVRFMKNYSKTFSDKSDGFWKLWSLKNLQKTKFSPFLGSKFEIFWQKRKLLKVEKLF